MATNLTLLADRRFGWAMDKTASKGVVDLLVGVPSLPPLSTRLPSSRSGIATAPNHPAASNIASRRDGMPFRNYFSGLP
jgi:hypothetical protein